MKTKALVLMSMMCLILCCSTSITAMADGDHSHKHTYTTYGEHAGHWNTACKEHENCTIYYTVDKLTKVCSCGHTQIEYDQKAVHSHQ